MDFEIGNYSAFRAIPRVLRSERKFRGTSKSEMSKFLGISQTKLSEIEAGACVLDTSEWTEISSRLGIPVSAADTGFIDRGEKVTAIKESRQEGAFVLPEQFALHRASKNRAAVPYIKALTKEIGSEKLPALFETMGMDLDFFWNLDAQTNLDFVYDVVSNLMARKTVTLSDVEAAVDPKLLHRLAKCAPEKRHADDVNLFVAVQNFASACKLFDANFEYAAIDGNSDGCDFAIIPNEHIRGIKSDPQTFRFIDEYKAAILRWYCGMVAGDRSVEIHEVECMGRGNKRCVYRILLR